MKQPWTQGVQHRALLTIPAQHSLFIKTVKCGIAYRFFFYQFQDARPPEEYDVSHVKDALRVDPNAELSDVKKTIALLQEHHGMIC